MPVCDTQCIVDCHSHVAVVCCQGVLCRTLQGHGMWVNFLALSVDYVLRTGAFDPAKAGQQSSNTASSGDACSLLLANVSYNVFILFVLTLRFAVN